MNNEEQHFGLSDDMLAGNESDVPFHKFKNGAHKFRLAPPFDAKTLFHEEWIHWMKTKEGYNRAIPCGKRYFNGACPLCANRVILIKHRDKAEAMGDMARKQQYDEEAKLWGAKPTVLWNIMLGDDLKILQLSTNGHVELLKKVTFWWKEKRIALTNPQQNYLMYVERTGVKSTTRYTFEVVDSIPPISIVPIPKSFDLTKVYEALTLEEMTETSKTGFAPSYPNSRPKADPNAPLQEYQGPMISSLNIPDPNAQQPAGVPPQQFQQQPMANVPPAHVSHPAGPIQPAWTPPAGAFVPPTTQPVAPPPAAAYVPPAQAFVPPVQQAAPPVQAAAPVPAAFSPPPAAPAAQAPVNQSQEAEIANMLAALNQNGPK